MRQVYTAISERKTLSFNMDNVCFICCCTSSFEYFVGEKKQQRRSQWRDHSLKSDLQCSSSIGYICLCLLTLLSGTRNGLWWHIQWRVHQSSQRWRSILGTFDNVRLLCPSWSSNYAWWIFECLPHYPFDIVWIDCHWNVLYRLYIDRFKCKSNPHLFNH